jgi:hypothetical protein
MNEDHRARKAFLPSISEAVIYSGLSIGILFVINLVHILQVYGANGEVLLGEYLHRTIVSIAHSFDRVVGNQIATVFFWMLIGAGTYLITWMIGTIIHAYRNDLPPLYGFIAPRDYKREKVWHDALGRMILRFFATIGLIYWFYLFFARTLPYTSERFVGGLVQFSPTKLLDIALSIIVTAAGLFLFTILLRLIFLRVRVFH